MKRTLPYDKRIVDRFLVKMFVAAAHKNPMWASGSHVSLGYIIRLPLKELATKWQMNHFKVIEHLKPDPRGRAT